MSTVFEEDELELVDELFGLIEFEQGSSVVVQHFKDGDGHKVRIATKYSDEEDFEGWDWGLGITNLNMEQVEKLRDHLSMLIEKVNK